MFVCKRDRDVFYGGDVPLMCAAGHGLHVSCICRSGWIRRNNDDDSEDDDITSFVFV